MSTSVNDLPPVVLERTKQIIFDESFCAVYGRKLPSGDLTARYALQMGGSGKSTIHGANVKTSAPFAALANGTAGHADEVDGTHVVGGHPGATVVHAAVAVAQEVRSTGGELINAVALGYDVANRLVRSCGGVFGVKSRFQVHADFLHSLGAAVAASRLHGLSPEKASDAMALATFQANGLVALFGERRHVSKSFCHGQYAFAGVSAAAQSLIGLEGCTDILGAPGGALAAWGVEDAGRILMKDLGTDYMVMGANFKFINAGYPIHTAIEATMSLARDHAIDPSRIDRIEVRMPTNPLRVVDNRDMHNICLQDMLAAALTNGGLSLASRPFPEVLGNPRYVDLRNRISLIPDPELDGERPSGRCSIVTIKIDASTEWTRRIDWPKGHSELGGTTWEDLADKWGEALPAVNVARPIFLTQHLDELDDVESLVASFED